MPSAQDQGYRQTPQAAQTVSPSAFPQTPPFPSRSPNGALAQYSPSSAPYPEAYPQRSPSPNSPQPNLPSPNQPYASSGYAAYNSNPQETSRGTARDIRLGPSPRRRHELSSNPAFGQPRQRQRHGQTQRRYPGTDAGYQPVTHVNDPRRTDPRRTDPRRTDPRRTDPRQVGRIAPVADPSDLIRRTPPGQPVPGQAVQTQAVRTQSLQPRPVSPTRSRLGSQTARKAAVQRRSKRSNSPGQTRSIVKAKSRRRPPKPVSPMVYGLRLLILGTGVGVIAGTVISALNPAQMVQTAGMADIATVESTAANGSSQSAAAGIGGVGEGFPISDLAVGDLNNIPKQQPYLELSRQLEQMGQEQSGLLPGLFVLDLDTRNYVDVNGNMSFSAASTIKVPVLVAFFQDVEQNKIRLDEMLTMTETDVATGSGDMQYGTVGDQYSALETATKMIVISDNTATNMLIRRMGGAAALNQRFRSWGLSLTQIRNPLPDLEGTNTTSPSELTHLMALISEGQLLSLRSRDRMLDIMYRTKTRTLLPAGIGDDAAIAHKTGDIGSMVGDTGLVDTTTGKRYAITVLMGRPHNDTRAQELIRRMAGRIHEAIQSPPVVPPNPPIGPPNPSNQTETNPSNDTGE
ncbi:MAG: hypothetical protein F6K30_20435, partial [Cyanothece sp. SIO2G6]|nr:hypothetical protein [Cyanothece sp. SIO2G6]